MKIKSIQAFYALQHWGALLADCQYLLMPKEWCFLRQSRLERQY